MNLKAYLKTWEGLQAENRWGRIVQGALIAIVLVLVVLVARKETIVTVQPFTLSEEAWITKNDASRSYLEAWGFAIAQLLGNVTPGSVDFVKERLSPLLAPSVYQDVMDAVEVQAKEIRNDRITMRFEPRFVEYEPKSGKVFVYGFSYTRGASSQADEDRTERSYEFVLTVSNYLPVLSYIETYAGRPRTEVVLEQLKRKEENRKKRQPPRPEGRSL